MDDVALGGVGVQVFRAGQLLRFAQLFGLRKGEEGFNHAGFVVELAQVGLVDEVHQQTLFGTVAQAGANGAAHLFHQGGFGLDLFVVVEDQLQDVVQVVLLRLEQIYLKHRIVQIDASLLECGATLEASGRSELLAWPTTPEGRLAEVLVLDQFSSNVFRDPPEAFAQDALALALTQ